MLRAARVICLIAAISPACLSQATSAQSSSSNHVRKPAAQPAATLDAGSIVSGVYRNQTLGFICKIPSGWVLRTEEMNAPAPETDTTNGDAAAAGPNQSGRVLLAAFSRPPQATGEEINSSIVIVAESAATYPGLKSAAQYFGPLTEVATAQGFKVINEPYDSLVGTKSLVRADFAKDRGTGAMHQSTFAMLSHGYAVSFTFIGATEEEIEDLIGNLSFAVPSPRVSGKAANP